MWRVSSLHYHSLYTEKKNWNVQVNICDIFYSIFIGYKKFDLWWWNIHFCEKTYLINCKNNKIHFLEFPRNKILFVIFK